MGYNQKAQFNSSLSVGNISSLEDARNIIVSLVQTINDMSAKLNGEFTNVQRGTAISGFTGVKKFKDGDGNDVVLNFKGGILQN